MSAKNCFCFLLVILFFTCQAVYAQDINDSSNNSAIHSLLKIKISWNCGPEWGKKIGKLSTINFFGGWEIGPAADGFSFSNIRRKWIIEPDASVEYRNYYNFCRRNTNGKKTYNNSANFIFGRIETLFPVKNQNFFNLLFIEGWGLQRGLCKKISVDYHVGIIEHVYYDLPPNGGFNYIFLEPFLNLSINYVF